jgi:hypothetical protein
MQFLLLRRVTSLPARLAVANNFVERVTGQTPIAVA